MPYKAAVPSLSSRLMWRLLGWLYRAKGWHIEGAAPPARKYVIVGAPHTSNWDFVFFAGGVSELGIHPSFMGKHTLFRWPFRRFMFDMGGMPVDRSKPGGYVRSVIRALDQAEDMALVIAPEGTRSSKGRWRSGFYHIALGAGVPVIPAWFDKDRKRGGLGPAITLTGDYQADMARFLAFYRCVMPQCPRWQMMEAGLADETRTA